MGPGPENHQGTRYMPTVNHSTVVSEKYSLGSPTETPCIRVIYQPLWHIFPSLFSLIWCMPYWYLNKPDCVYLGQNKPLNSIRSGNRGEKKRRLNQTRTLMEQVELVEFLLNLIILGGKNFPAMQEMWVWSLGQEDPRRRKWQPTPVFLPGKSHGQRSLAGYSSWDHKAPGTTENTVHMQASPSSLWTRVWRLKWEHSPKC